ncbi:hypothetical protein TUMEXPCC7403_18325 [Tumidithrix helvetica PCC 7403]
MALDPVTGKIAWTPNAIGNYEIKIQATDPDAGDRIRYELINNGGATGLTVNPTTGLLSWNSPNTGTYKVVIGAIDDGGSGS